LLERIAKDPQAFILKQGWASVSLDGERGLKELRSLYEHLQARILEMIETLDELSTSAEMEIFHEVEQDDKVIDRIAAAQREELEREIANLRAEARAREEEIEELVGSSPF
jgi:FtsZ-binding cell division protein ZapB